jgi:hypothetical protein
MTSQWYCCIATQRYGPFPIEQLQQWVAEGRLQPDHHVCLVGQQEWTVARDVPQLFAPQPTNDLFAGVENYPQPHYSHAPAATAAAGFDFATSSTSSPTRRTYSTPKKKEQKFNWTGAIIAGVLASIGASYQVVQLVQKREQAFEQRVQEQRRRERSYRVPPPPPMTAPKIHSGDFEERAKKLRQPWQK